MAEVFPQFLAHVRGDGGQKRQHGRHGGGQYLTAFFRRGEFVLGEVQRVDQFHDRRNSGVELITVADVLTGFFDGEVFLEADFLGCRGRRVGGGGGAGPHGR